MIDGHRREVELAASQRADLWHGVQLRRARRRQWRRAALGATGLAGIAALVLVVSWVVRLGAPGTTAPVPVASVTPTKLTLPDGSQVVSEPGTELRVTESTPDRIRLDLARGRADFSVVHDPARRFSVVLPSVELRVVGTRFRVVVEEEGNTQRVVVEVVEGTVEVRTRTSAELLSRVGAGGRWSSENSRGTAAAAISASSAPPPVASQAHPRQRPAASGSAVPSKEAAEAAALFDAATRARRSDDYERAMAGYEELLARYPDDRHASLAALELGRLKRTRAEDPRGAALVLEQAAEDEELSDDALAQIVLSYDQAGDRERCRRARQRYLAAHPRGVHTAEVRSRCGGAAK
jgi:hypothetical protein